MTGKDPCYERIMRLLEVHASGILAKSVMDHCYRASISDDRMKVNDASGLVNA